MEEKKTVHFYYALFFCVIVLIMIVSRFVYYELSTIQVTAKIDNQLHSFRVHKYDLKNIDPIDSSCIVAWETIPEGYTPICPTRRLFPINEPINLYKNYRFEKIKISVH